MVNPRQEASNLLYEGEIFRGNGAKRRVIYGAVPLPYAHA